MKYKRILSIGAHSLDAELMGGPIIVKAVEKGAHCTFVHVTEGRLEDPNATDEAKQEYLEKIRKQNIDVAEAMGADVRAFRYISSDLPTEDDFIEELKEYFKNEKVDLIITHHLGTMHPRHYYTYYCVTEAVKKCIEEGVQIDLLYGENLEDLVNYTPQKYIELDEGHVKKWFNALSKYDIFNGKVNDVPYSPYYTTMGKVRAIESRSKKFIKSYMYASLIDKSI